MDNTLHKSERICKKKQIEQLFKGGVSKSMAAFPVRVVYMMADRTGNEPKAMMMASVSKRFFKKAVDRNRVKRQIREAYRKNKQRLTESGNIPQEKSLLMAFIWMDNNRHDTAEVEKRIGGLMERICEKICEKHQEQP